jgi:hypothetical protein
LGEGLERLGKRRFGLTRSGLVFQAGDELRQRAPAQLGMTLNRLHGFGCVLRQVFVAAHHHLANHAGQAHALAVFGAVDAGHAVVHQFLDLAGHNHAATATKHLDVRAAPAFQQIDHVLEVLDVPALVRAHGNALCVFLQRRGDHLVDTAVMPQMDHLGAHALQDAAHDVDGGVVTVEQAGGSDKAYFVDGTVIGQGLEVGGQVGHGLSPVGNL